jgi:hypothetical protein
MGTQIPDEVVPLIRRILYRNLFGPSLQWKGLDALYAEKNSSDLKVNVSSLPGSLKSITVTVLERASLTQFIFERILVLADQPRRRADEPRLGKNIARCVPKVTGFAYL